MNRPKHIVLAGWLARVARHARRRGRQSGSTPRRRGVLAQPGGRPAESVATDQKDADYAALAAGVPAVTLTNLDGSGYLARRLGQHSQRDRQPGYSPDQHVRLHAATTTSSSR